MPVPMLVSASLPPTEHILSLDPALIALLALQLHPCSGQGFPSFRGSSLSHSGSSTPLGVSGMVRVSQGRLSAQVGVCKDVIWG